MNSTCTVTDGTIRAIVYTSNAGHTARYARLLSEETGLKAYDLAAAGKALRKGDAVIYLGWLMAGHIKGYQQAAKRYEIRAVGAVGMASYPDRESSIRSANSLPASLPLFCLDGGLEMEKLHGINRLLIRLVGKKTAADLKAKPARTPDEEQILRLFCEGGSLVSRERLGDLIAWYCGRGA